MPLHSPHNYREKILAMGSFGNGKTKGWLDIALRSQQTKSDAKFYVLDTDDSVERMVGASERYSSLENLEVTTAYDWMEYSEWAGKVRSKVSPDDWLVVDFIDAAWDSVQTYFTEQVFKKDIGQYFLEARKSVEGGKPFAGFKADWQIINKLYNDFAKPLLLRSNAHIYVTTKVKKVEDDEKDRTIRETYGDAGVMPAGQKALGHQVHTIIGFGNILRGKGEKEFILTTVKDRERPHLTGEQWTNFAADYLVKVAGWRMS